MHAQQVDDIDRRQYRVEIVAHLHRPPVESRREQRLRRYQRDLGAERREREQIAARDTTVLDVAHDGDVAAPQRPAVLADRVAVE